MKKKITPIYWLAAGLVTLVIAGPTNAMIEPRSNPCATCHTMHNSQDGSLVTASGGPIRFLLNSSCLGCHTGSIDGSEGAASPATPLVLRTSEPTYVFTGTSSYGNTLAGGNYYWVQSTDDTGHNVTGISAQDTTHGKTPPGGSLMDAQLNCAGTYGCHGDTSKTDQYEAMHRSHHGNDSVTDGSSLARSYRFLNGIKGVEDSDWEFHPDNDSHNRYRGHDRYGDTESSGSETNDSISDLCARCHGDFHRGSGNAGVDNNDTAIRSPWIRHPTDIDMGNLISREYGQYGNDSGSSGYQVEVPLACDCNDTVNQDKVFTETDDAIVMCLSCHRSHGTPYASMLRWNYKAWPGGGYDGCGKCHTTKN